MGHWYSKDGTPCHTVTGRNQKVRATTLADARRLGLYPSVTTILDILAKPELAKWQQNQVALAARECGRMDGFEDAVYCDAVRNLAFKQVDEAADLGTRIHKGIEQARREEVVDAAVWQYVHATYRALDENEVVMLAQELRLVSKLGYAGTADAPFNCPLGYGIMDFKTRKSDAKYPMTSWPGQATQIAAYHVAHYGHITNGAIGCNCFVSTTEPGRVELQWYYAEELRKEWEVFQALLKIWQIRNSYVP